MAFPWLAAAVAGGSVLSYLGSRSSAKEQMGFQERMSGTSYQRSMADMRKAGLNPILAYQQGGASSPGGAGFQTPNIAEGAVSTALQMRRQKAELINIAADTRYKGAQTGKDVVTAGTIRKQGELIDIQKRIAEYSIHSAKAGAVMSDIDKEYFETWLGRLTRMFKLGNPFSSAKSVIPRGSGK